MPKALTLGAREVQLLASYVSDAVPTGDKLASWDYASSPQCAMCGEGHLDTQHACVFACKATGRLRRSPLPKEWREKVRDAGPEALTRLIVERPASPPPGR